MKFVINIISLAVVFSFLNATKFSDEEIKMFLALIRPWVPPSCPPNEIYKYCTGKCSDCIQRDRCIVTKCEEGCDCIPRFYRLTPDGPCEPVANCPIPECGENEVFRACGPVCEKCTTVKCHMISCDYKCYCKEGYLRNSDGVCIPEEECPKRTSCFKTEEWSDSGSVDEFCVSSADWNITYSQTTGVPGCYCKEGYKRNLLGYCVNETICPKLGCPGYEVYTECIPKCNTTCRNYGDPNCFEDDNCYPGCFCPSGYVMNDFRSCIPKENCSLAINQVKIIDTVQEYDDMDTTLPPTCPETDGTTSAPDSTTTEDTTEFKIGKDTAEFVAEEDTAEFDTKEDTAKFDTEEDTAEFATEEHTAEFATEEHAAEFDTEEHAAEFDSEKNTKASDTISATEEEQVTTSVTSEASSEVNVKSNKKEKIIKQKETKHENVAEEREALKYEDEEDEEGLGNDF